MGGGWQRGGVTGIDYLPTLHRLQDEFLAEIPRVDPAARVPACAPWRVRNLVEHLARIHHWAAGQARRKQETPLGRGPFDLVELYGRCAAELRETLTQLDPVAPAWTLVGNGPVAFWHRRQTHETLVHLWDLKAAAGLAVEDAPELWADAVDEVATMFQPRQVALGRTPPLVDGVELVCDDAPGRWLLGAWQPDAPTTTASATVTGPARMLALALWRRLTPDEAGLRVAGDVAAVDEALQAGRLTP